MDKSKIYGIEFDNSIPCSDKRIGDAVGLHNDYCIGHHFAGEGHNDFDDCYPFGALRLCCVSYISGKMHIVYENEEGFARDGSCGNVMVEIPVFYAKREAEGSIERWMISGTKHEGFSVEPAFVRDGEELPFVYVAAYASDDGTDGIWSKTGNYPLSMRGISWFEDTYVKAGYDTYDLAICLMLQRVISIEFGTRSVKQYLGGLQFQRYCSSYNENCRIEAVSPNTFTIKDLASRARMFAAGNQVGIGLGQFGSFPDGTKPEEIRVTLTDVRRNAEDPSLLDLKYEGEDLSSKTDFSKLCIYGIAQKNGNTDSLPYHTGRTDYAAPFANEGSDFHSAYTGDRNIMLNTLRYRNIENVWGSIWMHLSGLRMKDLTYYYTFDPALYAKPTDEQWRTMSYPVPVQRVLPTIERPDVWVDRMGFDPEEPLAPLPASIAKGFHGGEYYDAAFYAFSDRDYDNKPIDPHIEYASSVGGGWDHSVYGSMFTYRCFMSRKGKNWLYSNRICLRRKISK